MPVIEPTNHQQVLQMSSVVEKVQIQQVQHLAADQIQDQERAELDELKRTELQDPEQTQPAEPANPDEKGRRRRLRIKKSNQPSDTKKRGELVSKRSEASKEPGTHLDIMI